MALSIVFHREFKELKSLTLIDITAFSLIGLFGGALGTMAFAKAVLLANFNNLTVIIVMQKTRPIFAILLARIFLKEKLGIKFYYWMILIFVGVYLMTFGFNIPAISENRTMLYATMLSIGSAFLFGSDTVIGRYLSVNLKFVTITFYRYAASSFFPCLPSFSFPV